MFSVQDFTPCCMRFYNIYLFIFSAALSQSSLEVDELALEVDVEVSRTQTVPPCPGVCWETGRALPIGGVADGLRNADQHERQRGDQQPGHRDPRGQTRQQRPRASQRPRQQEPGG